MLLVYITAPDSDTARVIARTLVEERHAACVNIIDGMESWYQWQGKLEQARESICLCKTTKGSFETLERRVRELHPYDTPCIVAVPITHGHTPFLEWITAETLR